MSRSNNRESRSNNREGSSLIEVLVALTIVSFGALSSAAFELANQRARNEGVRRTAAAHLAYELAERLRALDETSLRVWTGELEADVAPAAARERDVWQRRLSSELAAADLCLARGPGNTFDLTLAWRGAIRLPVTRDTCGSAIDAPLRRTFRLRLDLLPRG